MTDQAARHNLRAEDELFHSPIPGATDWTETSYWGFYVPERKLSGTFYNLWRTHLGLVSSHVWIWDDTAQYPYEIPYCRPLWNVPIPANRDPTNFQLASGLRCERIEPLKSHRFTYSDPGLLELDLLTEGVTEPYNAFPMHSGGTGHFDQHIRVRGTLTLRGEKIDVDCISMRDRSWSPRPELSLGSAEAVGAYVHGGSLHGDIFLFLAGSQGPEMMTGKLQAMPGPDNGYLVRGGKKAPLTTAKRLILERNRGRPTKMRVEATDALNRELIVEGECVNHFLTPLSANIPCLFSLVRWRTPEGETLWGETQECWLPATTFRQFLVESNAL